MSSRLDTFSAGFRRRAGDASAPTTRPSVSSRAQQPQTQQRSANDFDDDEDPFSADADLASDSAPALPTTSSSSSSARASVSAAVTMSAIHAGAGKPGQRLADRRAARAAARIGGVAMATDSSASPSVTSSQR